jgi:hypothetical protein
VSPPDSLPGAAVPRVELPEIEADADLRRLPELLPEPAEPRRPGAFLVDVLACPCGGRRRVLSFITDKKVVKKILDHLGPETTGPPELGVRDPEVTDRAGEELAADRADGWVDELPPRWQDDVSDVQLSLP